MVLVSRAQTAPWFCTWIIATASIMTELLLLLLLLLLHCNGAAAICAYIPGILYKPC
jgi:hypothetical protein